MPLVLPGSEVERNEPGRHFERHHHLRSYAAVVIKGRCEEAGDRGRMHAAEGDVLIHRAFDGHRDQIGNAGAVFLNIPLSRPPAYAFGRVRDLDLLVRTLKNDPDQGECCLMEQLVPGPSGSRDWPDLLAESIASEPSIRLGEWADDRGIHPASLSRGFKLAYGVTPKRFRSELRVAAAARQISSRDESLASSAAEHGFADQAHMTRLFVRTLGLTPGALQSAC